MSFITNYSNLEVGATTTSANLTINAFNLGDISNVSISGGANGQILQTDGNGHLSWTAQTPAPGPGGANSQVQFNQAGVLSGNSNFTFDPASNTVSLVGTLTTPQLTVNGTINLGQVANTSIGGGTSGQALTSYGNGAVHWSFASGTGLNLATFAPAPDYSIALYFFSAPNLPAGSTGTTLYAATLADAQILSVGTPIKFSSDPTQVMVIRSATITESSTGSYYVPVTWDVPTRYTIDLSRFGSAQVLIPSTPVEFANLVIAPKLSSTLVNGNLTITETVPASSGQVLFTDDNNVLTGSSILNIDATTSTLFTTLLAQTGDFTSLGNVAYTNGGTSFIGLTGTNATNITSSNGQILANANTVFSGTTGAFGGYRRGVRFAEYRTSATQAAAISLQNSTWDYIYTAEIENNTLLVPGTNAAGSVYSWSNPTSYPLLVACTFQIGWNRDGGQRRAGIAINGDTTNVLGLTSYPYSPTDYTVTSGGDIFILPAYSSFGVVAWQNRGGPTGYGGACAGMPAGTSTKITFTIIN